MWCVLNFILSIHFLIKSIANSQQIRSNQQKFLLCTKTTAFPTLMLKIYSQSKWNQFAVNRKRHRMDRNTLKLRINKLRERSSVVEEMKIFCLSRNKSFEMRILGRFRSRPSYPHSIAYWNEHLLIVFYVRQGWVHTERTVIFYMLRMVNIPWYECNLIYH